VNLEAHLKRHFGFDGFRPGQREACEAAVGGRDVLVVMPTGSGKSLCYQLPALLRDDLTIVVSPLVALMKDQVDALRARVGDRVRVISGQQQPADNAAALEAALRGEVQLLYVAPERFSSPGFARRIARARIGLFVVDEAHCVSQWGHDFRPDYFRLADVARELGADAIVASTATATPRVATDIVRRLGLRDPLRVATGFDRPNLSFVVAQPGPSEKYRLLVSALSELPAIVYAGTRAASEQLADALSADLGVRALAYHAGLPRERRTDVQRQFLAGEAPVVVATNAFGMGIDKANVRAVVHTSVPASLEAYYQEAGRAGRDGAPARALLLAERRDKALHVHFIRSAELDPAEPRRLFERLRRVADGDALPGLGPDRYELAIEEVGRDPDRVRALVGHLARAGVVEPAPAPPDRLAGRIVSDFDGRADARTRASVGEAQRIRWQQYRDIWAYAEGDGCRRSAILRHFGDRSRVPQEQSCCDACDSTLAPVAAPARPPAELDEAILLVARQAQPSVGRTTCAEILHGARSKKIERNSYHSLAAYGTSRHLRRADILARIDELIDERRLRTTGGRYPVLVA
jgi:ATP-dependent DNA helicase RecQ